MGSPPSSSAGSHSRSSQPLTSGPRSRSSAAAFQAHPYHHSTIGWRSDIEKVSIEKLREFYDTFYWPDNATVTIIGDFAPAAGLALAADETGILA